MDTSPKRRRSNQASGIEHLETRSLPSGVAVVTAAGLLESGSNDTVDQAEPLGSSPAIQVAGKIDRQGVDVDWFTFTLTVPSSVTLNVTHGTLGLYQDLQGDYSDPTILGQHRLISQTTIVDGDGVAIQRTLAAGNYFLAVSAVGNPYFQPYVANSGLAGDGGEYVLEIDSSPLPDMQGIELLQSDATALSIRLGFSAPLPYSPLVELSAVGGSVIPVAGVYQNFGLAEVRIQPGVPLAPGQYQVVIRDSQGQSAFETTLTVAAHFGSEVGTEGNDTPATAISLGDVENQSLIQISGVIGDDPYYQLVFPFAADYGGNDVDLYHFQITSSAPVGLQAEVFAGRIGSSLDAGLSLFRRDPSSGNLVFVVGLNQSYNITPGTQVSIPLYFDPAITAGLTAGDYYLAVSHGANTTSPLEKQVPGLQDGLFDPHLPHSGSSAYGVGEYVLNLQVVPIPDPPEVLNVSIDQNDVLEDSPTELTVQFSEYINLTGLAFSAYQTTSSSTLAGVYFLNEAQEKFFPRLVSFDTDTLEARFLLLDRLPAGRYELHLSGELGLKNVVGASLVGNSISGDYVVGFNIDTESAGSAGNPLYWTHDTELEPATNPQQLGVLFPYELQAGVQIARLPQDGERAAKDTFDEYQFRILQEQSYFFGIDGAQLPRAAQLELFDANGQSVWATITDNGRGLTTQLSPGVYTLRASGWSGGAAKNLQYVIDMALQGNHDNAPPLWSGPTPAVSIRLAAAATPPGQNPGGNPGNNPGSNPGTFPPINGPIPPAGSSEGSVVDNSFSANLNRPAYLTGLSGNTRITLPDANGNLVIAVPNGVPSLNEGGIIRRASRSSRSSGTGKAIEAPGGFTNLADGLVGKTLSDDRARDRSVAAGRKLGALIESAISQSDTDNDERQIATDQRPATPPPEPADQDVVSADTPPDDPNAAAVKPNADESPEQAKARELSEKRSRDLLRLLSMDLNSDQGPMIAVMSMDGQALLDQDQPQADATALDPANPRALKYSDKVFAGGLGLLLSGLAATPTPGKPEAPRSAHGYGSRTRGRWCPTRARDWWEDSLS